MALLARDAYHRGPLENVFTLTIRLPPSPASLSARRGTRVVANDHTLHFSEKRVVVIGRGPAADVKIDDRSVDDTHAIISRERGWFEITDPGSKNGTLLGGIPLVRAEPRLLPSHAIVQVGEVRVEVSYGERPYEKYARIGAPDVARAALLREQAERDEYPLRLVIVAGELPTVLELNFDRAHDLMGLARAGYASVALAGKGSRTRRSA